MTTIILCLLGLSTAIAQDISNVNPTTPNQVREYTLTSLFAVAIAVQYWENRKKDTMLQSLLEKSVAAQEQGTAALDKLTEAVERIVQR